ncbi:M28 family metallopeptidase [Terracoccus sp. 273MFTsu3.1]|uniref:M28 family metallopeptidase n=1 Tax=Terracoccus sp. 273MFTsu3.1 TaxID=1172188 RepID=UPI0012DE0710|nr:M20/M25/M40 family metallo-hydrolase [Terracoccus sp. 273MFTsu3.1]
MAASTRRRRRSRTALAVVALVAAATACTGGTPGPGSESASGSSAPTSSPRSAPTAAATPTPTASTPSASPSPSPSAASPVVPPVADPFDVDTVLGGIRALAAIGPRDAASRASDRAAAYVAGRLRASGYRVTLQPVAVPAGVSWGVRVPAGTTVDVVADPPGLDPTKPHVVVGAHLDTVPQSPGAEDNASGLMVMAEVARMTRQQPGALPVRFVAFGAEEARGGNGTLYAFGSRHFVAGLGAPERRAVRGMVALDRVGVRATAVPVCHVAGADPSLADAIRRAASRVAATRACLNRASDHVSFERVGIPAVRIGSVPYAAYHSSTDVPAVVDRGQLARSGAVLWAWIRSLR